MLRFISLAALTSFTPPPQTHMLSLPPKECMNTFARLRAAEPHNKKSSSNFLAQIFKNNKALHVACEKSNLSDIKQLLQEGADIHAFTNSKLRDCMGYAFFTIPLSIILPTLFAFAMNHPLIFGMPFVQAYSSMCPVYLLTTR